jgi:hypothetical protein
MYSFPHLVNIIYNLIMPEVKFVAPSEDCNNDVNWAAASSSTETVNNLPDVVVPASKVVVYTRPVIVFDIDDTICKRFFSPYYGSNEKSAETVKKVKLSNPEAPSGMWDDDHYLCLPYLDSLFNYLIDHKARIVFFSAGIEERNIALLEQVMPQYLGKESYETLKAQGQFKIFSRGDLTETSYENPGEGRYFKDLNKVINNGLGQKNAILIDDDRSYIPSSQRTYIQPLDLSDWNVFARSKEGYKCFAGNGAYYLLGIFKEYFEKEQYSAIKLQDGITKVYKERGVSIFKEYHAKPQNPFVRAMVYIGLEEVQKTHPEAALYGELYFKEPPHLIKYFS